MMYIGPRLLSLFNAVMVVGSRQSKCQSNYFEEKYLQKLSENAISTDLIGQTIDLLRVNVLVWPVFLGHLVLGDANKRYMF